MVSTMVCRGASSVTVVTGLDITSSTNRPWERAYASASLPGMRKY